MLREQLRQSVRRSVEARQAADDREAVSLTAFIDAFDRLERPFDEYADITHVTGSAIVVGDRGVLLHKHKRLGIWLQPGGHIDDGEAPWDGALREATEETGLDLRLAVDAPEPTLVHVDVHPGPRGHTHLDLRYLITGDDSDPSPPEGESQEVFWFPWCEAIGMAEPGLIGALEATQPGPVRLRRARPTDGAAMAATYLASRRHFLPTVPIVHTDDEVERYFVGLANAAECWLADEGGAIIGLCIFGADDWLDHLYLAPGSERRGIGSQLLRLAKKRRPTGLQLWTFAINTRARAFYEAHGFAAVEFTDGSGNEEGAPDIRYVWAPND